MARPEDDVARRLEQALGAIEGLREVVLLLTTQDPLTGLPNRVAFDRDTRRQRVVANAGVVAVELEGFKHLNWRYGHSGGDRILEEVGRRLGEFVAGREGWQAYHLSGDEFVLTAADASGVAVLGSAEGLKQGIELDTYPAGADPGTGADRFTDSGEVRATIAVAFRDQAATAADWAALHAEADRLVECGKVPKLWPDGLPPRIITMAAAAEACRIHEALLGEPASRERVFCPRCGRFGVIQTPLAFRDCPECELLVR